MTSNTNPAELLRRYNEETAAAYREAAAAVDAAHRANASVVWSADKGWHDGPDAHVAVDAAGRFTVEVLP
jgi:hypothetical protein